MVYALVAQAFSYAEDWVSDQLNGPAICRRMYLGEIMSKILHVYELQYLKGKNTFI